MKLIAHRGLKLNQVKENSIQAFQNAIEHAEYAGFELDVRTSRDGVFMVHHNLFVDKELVRFLDAKTLQTKYHLATLEEVLKLKTDKIILIEIKEANLDIDAFVSLLNRYKNRRIYVDSFDNEVIQKLSKQSNYFRVGVLNYVFNSERDYSEYDFIGLLAPIITEELIDYFKKRKMEVFLYGIRDQADLGKWEDVYYITDAIVL